MLFETNFSLVSIMFIVITGIIILMLIKTIVTSFSQKRKNDRSPVLLVEAVIVGKRMNGIKFCPIASWNFTGYNTSNRILSHKR